MANSIKTLRSGFILIVLLWTVAIGFLLYQVEYYHSKDAQRIAMERVQMGVTKDIAYRTWVSFHGGVYVPITKDTPPNPYLSHIKYRDVVTTDGQQLTLMNPAYTLRQLMSQFKGDYGQESRITSLKVLNPINAPDSWEVKALLHVEKNKAPYSEFLDWQGQPMLRYMQPMVTKEACLKCHGHQGYKVGEVRGGVSVRILTDELEKEFSSHTDNLLIVFGLIWLVGIGVLGLTFRKISNDMHSS